MQVTLVKDNIMPRLIILSSVNDEGVRVDASRAYASISSNAQCQVSPNKQATPATLEYVFRYNYNWRCLRVPEKPLGNRCLTALAEQYPQALVSFLFNVSHRVGVVE